MLHCEKNHAMSPESPLNGVGSFAMLGFRFPHGPGSMVVSTQGAGGSGSFGSEGNQGAAQNWAAGAAGGCVGCEGFP